MNQSIDSLFFCFFVEQIHQSLLVFFYGCLIVRMNDLLGSDIKAELN